MSSCSRGWGGLACGVAFGALLAWSMGARAEASEIMLGPADSLALDQPRVDVRLVEQGVPVGPTTFSSFLLDTGANSVLTGFLGHFHIDFDTIEFFHDPDMYDQAQRTDPDAIAEFGTDIFYEEIGVAGTQPLRLFVPYVVEFGAYTVDGVAHDHAIASGDAVHTLGEPLLDMGSFGGLIGMPAMVDRVTHLDLANMTPGEDLFDFIRVDFREDMPAPTSQSFHVPLTQLPTEHTGQIHPDDPLPHFDPIPLVPNVGSRSGGGDATSTWLLDTGAQLSLVMHQTALDMGVDPFEDALDFLPIGGVGGEVTIPLIALDELTIPTVEGPEFVFEDMIVGVLDIEELDGVVGGILGMNVLTSGYIQHILESDENGAFTDVMLDFTDPEQWMMRLEVNPEYASMTEATDFFSMVENAEDPLWTRGYTIIPEPASGALLALMATVMLRRPRRG